MTNYRETTYTCPACGTACLIPEIGDTLPAPAPILHCPRCRQPAYRTSSDEQYTLQNYHRYRNLARDLIEARIKEQETRP
ncbi:MAG TPA: hypothetical protein O0Y06_07620 [Methanocorpusculum sp.]|nr:hypothetical protein [Methanocorpusculum sp.]HJK80754.1 hypothetical protein [Methanocorpusculum sp.]